MEVEGICRKMKNINEIDRIGIFCFYDKEGIVDEYVDFLLGELCPCLSRLVIVVNGTVNDIGKNVFKKYTKDIYIRENKGFDSGAYKDVIDGIIGWDNVQKYDELILCNDTFYGPFIPFGFIFEKMHNKNVDFWGLNYYYDRITNHIQSFFLVFKKRIISERFIIKYFDENISLSTNEITDVYIGFELGLYQYLISKGYLFAAYSEHNPFNLYYCGNIAIREYGTPILKKKAFSPECYINDNIMDSLKYLSQNSNYNLDLILNSIKRIYKLEITKKEIQEFNHDKANMIRIKNNVAKISDKNIKDIVASNKIIYVYGIGTISGKISKIIDIYEGKINGYIISDDQSNFHNYKNGIKVSRVSEIIDDVEGTVIIVALGEKNTKEVIPYLKRFKDVVFLW